MAERGNMLGTALAITLVMNQVYNVLLVDDEPEILVSLKRTLRGVGLDIHTARSPQEALALLKTTSIDVIISDHDMPQMKGLDLLQQVRLSRPNVVRILLTGRSDLTLALRALNEGAVHKFLLKPWDRVDLRGVLNLALRSANPGASMPVQTSDQEA